MMELHTLKSAPAARRKSKRVGRGEGSGHGKTSCRGAKGQKARSGYSSKPGFEGGQMPLHRRLPKRGFYHEKRHGFAEINLDVLEQTFENGATVSAAALCEAGIIRMKRGGVKLLGRGDITKRLVVEVQAVSAGARAKIEQAGGSVVVTALPTASAAAEE